MHDVKAGPQLQEPPVQVSEKEHWFPQRPQLDESLMNEAVSTHDPWHHSCPAVQLAGPLNTGPFAPREYGGGEGLTIGTGGGAGAL
jgi:hypothetical protein